MHIIVKLPICVCRYKGFYEYAKLKGIDVGKPVGLDVIVDGTVPTGIYMPSDLEYCPVVIK